jgi:outer membrane protein OmpA-like peptidoglycan-associated protein
MMKRISLGIAALLAAGCSSGQPVRTAQAPAAQTSYATPSYAMQSDPAPTYRQADWVGPRGADGPVGAQGAQGPAGQIGPAGYAVAGPQGAAGQTGLTGAPGPMGAQGPAGRLAVGPTGPVGPAGATGPRGGAGQTGARGASADGFAGPQGPIGPTGARGAVGETGVIGPTLVGPAGPAGRPGATGAQGELGLTGAQGATTAGVAGPMGVVGATGARGPVGSTGPQGPTGVVERWTSNRDFWFDRDQSVIYPADQAQVAAIAAYMKANPSLILGIDGSTNPRATRRQDQDLNSRRVSAVRSSLLAAGVPAARISDGMFGDVNLRRDGRVELLIKTGPLAQTQHAPAGTKWTPYQDFWFDTNGGTIVHQADMIKVSDVAVYMNQDPSLQVGIDNSSNGDQRSVDLAARRSDAIRDALIAAGAPASRISSGAYGDPQLRRDGRVQVFVRASQMAKAH